MYNDDDDPPSHTSPSSPSSSSYPSLSTSPPPPPPPISIIPPLNGHPHSVTVATPSPNLQTLTLALPIQHPSSIPRDDCWSDGATSALIDAWGEHFLQLSRGNLKQKHWQEVADVVSSRNDYTKPPRSDIQCKNRIDTLKKKYKLERSRLAAAGGISGGISSWPFFNRLDILLGPIMKFPTPVRHPTPAAVAAAARSQFPQKQRTNLPAKRKATSPPAIAAASSTSDSLPPDGRKKGILNPGVRELTRAILKFGEVYHKVESSKLQQAMEMEKQRMGFARELEMQRMQFFMKTQLELSQLRPRRTFSGGGGGGGSSNNYHNNHSRRHHQHQSAGNNDLSG